MSKDKILIVYPDEDICKMFEIYFTGHSYDVFCVGDKESALKLIASENIPNAIIIKEGVSRTDGYELREALRHINDTKFIPIVFITHNPIANKMDELESIYDDFVTIPFDIEELELRVQNTIKRSRQNG